MSRVRRVVKELPFTVKEGGVVCRTTREGAAVYGWGGRAFELRPFFSVLSGVSWFLVSHVRGVRL